MRRWLAILLVFSLWLVPGCWGRREIDELALVEVVGLDRGPDGGIVLSAQVLRLGQGSDRAAGADADTILWSVSGATTAEAMHRLGERSSRQPFYGYVRAVVVGEELARQGVGAHLDFMARDADLRRTVLLLIAKDMTALELLQARPALDPELGAAIDLLARHASTTSVTRLTPINLFFRQLSAPGIDPAVAALTRENRLGGGTGEEELALAGMALFRDDRLVGYLDRIGSRGLLWARSLASQGAVVATFGEYPVTFMVLRQGGSIRPLLVDGHPRIRIVITLEAEVTEYSGPESLVDPRPLERFEDILSGAVRSEVEQALLTARQLGVDVFGFGQSFFRSYHTVWQRELAPRWEQVLSDLPVEIEVTARLRRAGLRPRATPGLRP